MQLKNGYKVMYEIIEDNKRIFKASTTGVLKDAKEILSIDIGTYKVVYQKGNAIFGIKADGSEIELNLNEVFVETKEDEVAPASVEVPVEEPTIEPEVISEDKEELPEESEEV